MNCKYSHRSRLLHASQETEIILEAPDRRTKLIARGSHAGVIDGGPPPFEPGATLKVRVLDVDLQTQMLDVTTQTALVKEGKLYSTLTNMECDATERMPIGTTSFRNVCFSLGRAKRRKAVPVLNAGQEVHGTVVLRKNKYGQHCIHAL
jgi:hypothetical protein